METDLCDMPETHCVEYQYYTQAHSGDYMYVSLRYASMFKSKFVCMYTHIYHSEYETNTLLIWKSSPAKYLCHVMLLKPRGQWYCSLFSRWCGKPPDRRWRQPIGWGCACRCHLRRPAAHYPVETPRSGIYGSYMWKCRQLERRNVWGRQARKRRWVMRQTNTGIFYLLSTAQHSVSFRYTTTKCIKHLSNFFCYLFIWGHCSDPCLDTNWLWYFNTSIIWPNYSF